MGWFKRAFKRVKKSVKKKLSIKNIVKTVKKKALPLAFGALTGGASLLAPSLGRIIKGRLGKLATSKLGKTAVRVFGKDKVNNFVNKQINNVSRSSTNMLGSRQSNATYRPSYMPINQQTSPLISNTELYGNPNFVDSRKRNPDGTYEGIGVLTKDAYDKRYNQNKPNNKSLLYGGLALLAYLITKKK